jgi:hypothetical protein
VLTEEVGISESTLRVILYHLENRGYIRRAPYDYGTRARLKLKEPPQAIRTYLERAPLDDRDRSLLERLLQRLQFKGADVLEFDVREHALALNTSPVDLERAVLTLTRRPHERVVYRSWDRGLVLSIEPAAVDPAGFAEDLFVEQRQAAHQRLTEMRRYALGRACRRQVLVHYLGEHWSLTNCAACDNCATELQWPWAGRLEPAPDLEGGIDVLWEVLRAVAGANGRSSRLQLEAALRGQDRYGFQARFPVPRPLLLADFFGRLQYVPKVRCNQAFDTLRDRGLIEASKVARPGYSYESIEATAAGRAALAVHEVPTGPTVTVAA